MQNDPRLTMPTNYPTAKLIVSQVAVFVVPLLWYWLSRYTPVPLPENGESLLDALFQSVALSLIGLGAGWVKRPAARDVPIQEDGSPAPVPPEANALARARRTPYTPRTLVGPSGNDTPSGRPSPDD